MSGPSPSWTSMSRRRGWRTWQTSLRDDVRFVREHTEQMFANVRVRLEMFAKPTDRRRSPVKWTVKKAPKPWIVVNDYGGDVFHFDTLKEATEFARAEQA